MALHIESPLLPSHALSRQAGLEVFLKLDAVQPAGSFKIRGIGHACEVHQARGARRFISSSGGNAGYAVAYAGRQLGIPVTVVVPETTSEHAKAMIAQEDAQVIVHGASWHEANEHAQGLLDGGSVFIHPFDDPLLWEGHATMMVEAARQMPKPDVVICSVGGGGLLAGVAHGLEQVGWGDVGILAAETVGADSFAQALRAGAPVLLEAITSIASSLGARQVSAQVVGLPSRLAVRSCVLTDADAVRGCDTLLATQRLLTEPACGVSIAALDEVKAHFPGAKRVLVIVCGGVGTTAERLMSWRAQYLA